MCGFVEYRKLLTSVTGLLLEVSNCFGWSVGEFSYSESLILKCFLKTKNNIQNDRDLLSLKLLINWIHEHS